MAIYHKHYTLIPPTETLQSPPNTRSLCLSKAARRPRPRTTDLEPLRLCSTRRRKRNPAETRGRRAERLRKSSPLWWRRPGRTIHRLCLHATRTQRKRVGIDGEGRGCEARAGERRRGGGGPWGGEGGGACAAEREPCEGKGGQRGCDSGLRGSAVVSLGREAGSPSSSRPRRGSYSHSVRARETAHESRHPGAAPRRQHRARLRRR